MSNCAASSILIVTEINPHVSMIAMTTISSNFKTHGGVDLGWICGSLYDFDFRVAVLWLQ